MIDHEQKTTNALLKEAAKNANTSDPSETLAALDGMISRMEKMKRRLQVLSDEEQSLHDKSAKRIRHLQELYRIPSLTDATYEAWSRKRLDILTGEFLLSEGLMETAAALAKSKDVEDFIDLDIFASCHKIADSIQRGQAADALQWIKDNRDALKKLVERDASSQPSTTPTVIPKISTLEYELRFQEYIELLRQIPERQNARVEALAHAQKYLYPHNAAHPSQTLTLGGLLAQSPKSPTKPYAEYFAPARWTYLSQLFIETHHQLYNLPTRPLLHVALSAGLSALKTPACHSPLNPASSATTDQHPKFAPSSAHNAYNPGTSLCPICSTELNALARSVPYAHHTKSYVENDPLMLPNGRVYGRERLLELERKHIRPTSNVDGTAGKGDIRDPMTNESFKWSELKRVFIT